MRPSLRLAVALGAALLALWSWPHGARAQSQSGCRFSAGYSNTQDNNITFLSGPVRIDCRDGTTVRADSAINLRQLQEYYLIGHVFYSDTIKSLTADWVHYQSVQRTLQGKGHVVVRDLKTGSSVRGDQLLYFRPDSALPGRQQARVIVEGGRPHAELYGQGDAGGGGVPGAAPGPPAAAGPGAADSTRTIVDADVIELDGQTRFHATGNVEIRRGTLQGFGQQADFDQASNDLRLVGKARVVGKRYTLSAARIDGHLDARNRLDSVHALGTADLEAEQASVQAPELRIQLENGAVRRLIALGSRRVAKSLASKDSAQAVAVAQRVRLMADSIDGYGSGQRLDSIYAVGYAYGEQHADTVRTDLPQVLRSDWARGDTIRAYFTEIPDTARATRTVAAADTARATAADTVAVADTAAGRRPAPAGADSVKERMVLDRLVVVGSDAKPAQTVYRSRRSGESAKARPSINYMVAKAFTIRMSGGQVAGVEAQGPVHGVHLDPSAAGDTARADTTGQRAVGAHEGGRARLVRSAAGPERGPLSHAAGAGGADTVAETDVAVAGRGVAERWWHWSRAGGLREARARGGGGFGGARA